MALFLNLLKRRSPDHIAALRNARTQQEQFEHALALWRDEWAEARTALAWCRANGNPHRRMTPCPHPRKMVG